MLELQATSDSHPENGYPSISDRAWAFIKLRDAYLARDGIFGEHLSMAWVPPSIVMEMNNASSHADIIAIWNRWLVNVVTVQTIH